MIDSARGILAIGLCCFGASAGADGAEAWNRVESFPCGAGRTAILEASENTEACT